MAGGSKQKTKPKEIKKVFNRLDLNADKKISAEELMDSLKAFGANPSMEEVKQMMKELYSGGSGHGDCGVEELREEFDLYKDKNGLLSAKKLQQILSKLISNNVTLQDCAAMIKSVDSNGDGLVNFEEFKKVMTKPFTPVCSCDSD